MTTYKLAIVASSQHQNLGAYESADAAYAVALANGPGTYHGIRDADGGRHPEVIRVTEDDRVMVRNAGKSDWSEWDD